MFMFINFSIGLRVYDMLSAAQYMNGIEIENIFLKRIIYGLFDVSHVPRGVVFLHFFSVAKTAFLAAHIRRYRMRSIKKSQAHQQIKHGKCQLFTSLLVR